MGRERIINAVTDWLVIALFGALISVPLILALTGPGREYSRVEKRSLAPFPELRLNGGTIRELTRAIDHYYQDHFGLRELLIHRYQREVSKRFGGSTAGEVVAGEDGWLFFAGEQVVDDFVGRAPFRPDQLKALATVIRESRARLAEKGIRFLMVVAPNKQSIYPEYLPEHYRQARGPTRLDQAVALLNRDPATAVLDLRPVLLRNKGERRLYDKTDTHWNQLGAYCGYREMARVIADYFPGEDLDAHFSVGALWRQDPAGDLVPLSGRTDILWETRPEVLTWQRAKKKELSPALRALLLPEELAPEFTVRPGKRLRVLVLHDSFMIPMKLFLSETFGEVLYIRKYYDRKTADFYNREVMAGLLAEYEPDLVLEQIVERHLDWLLPESAGQADPSP
ncbi:MAG: hypothetical protein C4575_04510 [Desulforudis sp.]|nr:MAG: hypothetical protein C4575_04510 [Desulforudis sp.]